MSDSFAAEALLNVMSDHAGEEGLSADFRESLAAVANMFAAEDRGWERITGFNNTENIPGLALRDLKDLSERIREAAVGNPLIKRAISLRTSYIFSKGVNIPGYDDVNSDVIEGDKKAPKKKGRKSKEEIFFTSSVNKAHVFSPTAFEEMEKAASSDGVFILLGEKTTKDLRPIPLHEITGVYTNPDFSSEIWAYQRTWTRMSLNGEPEQVVKWYMVDTYPHKQAPKSINKVQVDDNYTVIDQRFNTQTGWTFGVPDATAAVIWSQMYSELIHNGRIMTKALAKIAFQVTSQTNRGARAAGTAIANKQGAGQTAAMAAGNSLTPVASAGKTYDFNGLRPIASMVATAMEVSVIHLLSDPGAAGSSYGSASNLDMPTKRAMTNRQALWADFLERVVKWGTNKDVKVVFPDMDDPDLYREQQVANLAWSTGLIHGDEMRDKTLLVSGIKPMHEKAPKGFMLPNNEESLGRKDVDADAQPDASKPGDLEQGPQPDTKTGIAAGAPDQGKSNNAGGVNSTLANDVS